MNLFYLYFHLPSSWRLQGIAVSPSEDGSGAEPHIFRACLQTWVFKDGCFLALTGPFKPEAMGLDSSYLDNTSQLCPVWFCLPFFLNTVVQIRKDIDGADVCEGVQSPFVNVVRTLTTSRRQDTMLSCASQPGVFRTECHRQRLGGTRRVLQDVWGGPTRCVGRSSYRVGQGVWGGPTGYVGRSYRGTGCMGRSYKVGQGVRGRSYRVGHEEELNGSF